MFPSAGVVASGPYGALLWHCGGGKRGASFQAGASDVGLPLGFRGGVLGASGEQRQGFQTGWGCRISAHRLMLCVCHKLEPGFGLDHGFLVKK